MDNKVFIYGLFDLSGHCWRVGQTKRPKGRRYQHLASKSGICRKVGLLSFRILRTVSESDASRIERQIIKAYWKRKQAQLSAFFNVQDDYIPHRCSVVMSDGLAFQTIKEAAKACGVATTTIRRNSNRIGRTVFCHYPVDYWRNLLRYYAFSYGQWHYLFK